MQQTETIIYWHSYWDASIVFVDEFHRHAVIQVHYAIDHINPLPSFYLSVLSKITL